MLGQADEVLTVGNLRRWRFLAAVVKVQQVNIGTVIQFVAAQLSQRQHRKAGIGHATFRVKVLGGAITVLQLGVYFAKRFFDQYVRESRNFACGFRQTRHTQYVAQHDANEFALLETCQQNRRIGFKRARAHTSEALLKLLPRVGPVQAAVAHKNLKQVTVVDQGPAQPWTDCEHDDSIVNQEAVFLQQPQRLG